MKQILSLTLVLALMAALFTGCACTANVSTDPNGMITEAPTTRPAVMPTPTGTHATTRPAATHETTHPTMPHIPGTDPTLDGSAPSDATAETRQRSHNAVR